MVVIVSCGRTSVSLESTQKIVCVAWVSDINRVGFHPQSLKLPCQILWSLIAMSLFALRHIVSLFRITRISLSFHVGGGQVSSGRSVAVAEEDLVATATIMIRFCCVLKLGH